MTLSLAVARDQVAMRLDDGRTLLGDVIKTHRRNGIRYLTVRHFNGEPWPLSPRAGAVEVLERTYEGDIDR